ncbi:MULTISPECIES: ABC transporter substrate-binding protein [unclassified Polaromonas]|jgi:branched-chain amino acid transport system substrate-binding protein|uniref:ABC transporter substrate-binding protein n=1 Tax=unclassified Polaromonas TaxID=2638319 RepID=UPI000BD90290|nr:MULTISPECIES: ABC transporter substrate-binding protein [unclassified Polaromonas]OYY32813.1 MAG: ABC transporter permease [Polaromonas sp. 35-63-35]OYZ16042.1 MAG: ABC transporter permease [Polaromonas sp. 16-63-31]OYZ76222.1 MAG: ABC transporter permease [Polaromonas sp. 24-63-21]OZA47441.1 MAG: ABC transporter permease [Polaromonas sp. 17-63-33]OZA85531.1 MAG: ABC transporter permease [Polaromonas sp. 39-63-25]
MTAKSRIIAIAASAIVFGSFAVTSFAQEKQQFFPLLTFRTGPYAPSGTPWANGFVDYFKLVNAKGGINGVSVLWEECETGYATDRGVECYERLKRKNGGATVFQTMSTGITLALTERGAADGIPILTPGYGLSESADGQVFKWSFPIAGSHWTSADTQIQYLGQKVGGLDKLKGKKITLLYHDSPYGKEAIPVMNARSKEHGFDLVAIPVSHPGVDQKAAWLQIRQARPDYVLLWGWGVMNSTALKEAQSTGFRRDRIVGVWPSGSDSDVKGVSGADGYSAVLVLPGPGFDSKIAKEVLSTLHAKGEGAGPKDEVGSALYMRGLMNAMLAVEGVWRAQEKFGKGQVMNAAQTRWGYENLNIDENRLQLLGLDDVMRPVVTSCKDHMGPSYARAYTWNGKSWETSSDWLEADTKILTPLLKAAVEKYAGEKKLTRRTPADCQS